jgi:hypothetical protein
MPPNGSSGRESAAFGRPSFVSAGESSTNSKPRLPVKNSIAES